MKRFLAITGFLLLLPGAVQAAPSLYETVQDSVRKELMIDATGKPKRISSLPGLCR